MKRYVLLENKEIVDTTLDCGMQKTLDMNSGFDNKNYIVDEINFFHVTHSTKDNYYYCLGKVKRQSDNLIDLLEVGDCVEFTSGSISYIVSDDNMTYMTTNFKEIIVAVWKRQGDIMRRYEV